MATGQDTTLSSFPLLMENVIRINRDLRGHDSNTGFAGEFKLPYVGPLTFQTFLENFCIIFSKKKSSLKSEVACLKKALSSLEKTSEKVSSMKDTLSGLEEEYRTVSEECSQLLQRLTLKSCQVNNTFTTRSI